MTEVYHTHQLPLFSSKVCSQCSIEKPLEQFSKDRTHADGYRSSCKSCHNQQRRDCKTAHREQKRQYNQKYYAAHREQLKQQSQDYRASDPERTRQQSRASYARRAEYHRQYSRDYGRIHYEHRRQYAKTWRQSNVHKRRELNRRRDARKRNATIDMVNYKRILERDGMFCYICEQVILPHHVLNFDHVIPLARGGAHSEENIKVAHDKCNFRKKDRLLSEMDNFDRRGIAE